MVGRPEFEAFVAVARSGNFTQTARTMNLSQPALSRRISGIEEYLGVPILERRKGQTILTQAGHALLPHAEAALAHFRDGIDAVRALRQGARGTIVLAAPTGALCRRDLVSALLSFRKEYPAVELSVRTNGSSQAVSDWLKRGEATVGLGFNFDDDSDLSSTPIGSEITAVICAPHHRLLAQSMVLPEELVEET